MKTISLEIDERVYTQVVGFLRLLPEECCHVFEEDDTNLDMDELATVKAIKARLQSGDDSEFVDWDDIKEKLVNMIQNKGLPTELSGVTQSLESLNKRIGIAKGLFDVPDDIDTDNDIICRLFNANKQ